VATLCFDPRGAYYSQIMCFKPIEWAAACKEREMSIGLIALLDDVAAIAKVAAASLDDVVAQAAKAGVKAAGIVIDDAAVTPRYVVGFAASRELPIVAKIAVGSLRNKLIYLTPGALALGAFAPGAITPLLMAGGGYLCFEGTEKLAEKVFPHVTHEAEEAAAPKAADAQALEDRKVAGAIRTDLILSAEIVAITLAAVPAGDFWMQAMVLILVGVAITVVVYGGVALIVKADDVGVALARNASPSAWGSLVRAMGRILVKGMPGFLTLLAAVGTAAMIWVGGGILVHGLEVFGFATIAHLIHDAADHAATLVPAAASGVSWLVTALGSGLVGSAIGAALIPIAAWVVAPILRLFAGFGSSVPDQ
jgi:predicted DNA repair protein MutK